MAISNEKSDRKSDRSLLYKRARYYDVTSGEFASQDPLGFDDGMSLYRGYYLIDKLDPSGNAILYPDENTMPIDLSYSEEERYAYLCRNRTFRISVRAAWEFVNVNMWRSYRKFDSCNDKFKQQWSDEYRTFMGGCIGITQALIGRKISFHNPKSGAFKNCFNTLRKAKEFAQHQNQNGGCKG